MIPWRFVIAARDVRALWADHSGEDKTADLKVRLAIVRQWALALLDPLALFSRLFVLLTIYREKRLRHLLRTQSRGFFMGASDDHERDARGHSFSAHFLVMYEALAVVIDLPFLLIG